MDSSTEQSHAAALTETARGMEEALEFPAASAVFQGFGDSSVNFTVRMWIREHDQWPEAKTKLATAIAERLAREDITIPFPQRVVHYADRPDAAATPPEPTDRPLPQPEVQPQTEPATRPQPEPEPPPSQSDAPG